MTRWQDEHGIPVDDAGRYDAALIDWELLDEIPTIHDSWTAELKIETDRQRVWLERTTTADGEHCDHHITVETYDGNRWVTTSEN
jgi:hypothetical protein